MTYKLSVEIKPDHLHACVTGDNTPENVRNYLHEVYVVAALASRSRVLVEEHLDGPPLDPVEIYRLVRDASTETSPIILKIAYVPLGAQQSDQALQLILAVAHDQGINVVSFETVEEARDWLIAP